MLLETSQDPSATGGSDLDFVDADHGWFFNAQNLALGTPIFIFKTDDGGMHWSKVETTLRDRDGAKWRAAGRMRTVRDDVPERHQRMGVR